MPPSFDQRIRELRQGRSLSLRQAATELRISRHMACQKHVSSPAPSSGIRRNPATPAHDFRTAVRNCDNDNIPTFQLHFSPRHNVSGKIAKYQPETDLAREKAMEHYRAGLEADGFSEFSDSRAEPEKQEADFTATGKERMKRHRVVPMAK